MAQYNKQIDKQSIASPSTSTAVFLEQLYDLIAQIPYGRVTTYGRLAKALGRTRGARMVGWAMRRIPADRDLPCHRVVNRDGELSGGWHFGHPDIMKGMLLDEGVRFIGEYQVDLRSCLWQPWDDERIDLPTPDEVDDFDFVAITKHR